MQKKLRFFVGSRHGLEKIIAALLPLGYQIAVLMAPKQTPGRREIGSTREMTICRQCGCTPAQATADALVLGFQDEYRAGIYNCCQVVAWADEQWIAWTEAAVEDGKSEEEATKPLEVHPRME